MKIKLLLGNMTFNHFSDEELSLFSVGKDHVESDNKPLCLVHDLHGILLCDSKEQANKLGEELSYEFGAYVIPALFNGEIAFETVGDEKIIDLIGKN